MDNPMINLDKSLSVNGVHTAYLDVGAGDTVVLLHGASLAIDTVSTWNCNVDDLARRFRVIAFDQIGFGKTGTSDNQKYINRIDRCGHAVAFLDLLGVKSACLVGHSEGGFMALRIALQRPDLVGKIVLVSSGSSSPSLGGELDLSWRTASTRAYNYATGADTEDDFIGMNGILEYNRDHRLDRILRDNYRQCVANGRLDVFRNLPDEETDYVKYSQTQEIYLAPYLKDLDVPTLLVWGKDDPTVPPSRGLALASEIRNSDFVSLARASHMVMWDRAEPFNATLRDWIALKPHAENH